MSSLLLLIVCFGGRRGLHFGGIGGAETKSEFDFDREVGLVQLLIVTSLNIF